jgi:hypothetical protein
MASSVLDGLANGGTLGVVHGDAGLTRVLRCTGFINSVANGLSCRLAFLDHDWNLDGFHLDFLLELALLLDDVEALLVEGLGHGSEAFLIWNFLATLLLLSGANLLVVIHAVVHRLGLGELVAARLDFAGWSSKNIWSDCCC